MQSIDNAGTTLANGKYTIENVMGENDFGITYKATQSGMNTPVCLLEHLPKEVKEEEFETSRQKFVEDAKTLAKFNHENIVRVLDIFEENNTAYLVIPFIEGQMHKTLIKSGSDLPKYIPQIELTKEYLKTQGIGEELLPKKPHFIFLPEYKVILVHFGSIQVFSNDKPQENKEEEKPQTEKVVQPTANRVEVQQEQKIQKPTKYKPQYTALACPSCKRPLPICICQKNKTINH